MKKLLLIYWLSVITHLTFSQSASQCTKALEEAEAAFEQGRLLAILEKTNNNGNKKIFYECLDNGSFTIDEEIRARKLLVKAYLFTDNEEEAEAKLVDLLIVDKEHQLTPEDPAELHFLYDKFITEPIFRVAFKGGINNLRPTVLQEFNSFASEDSEKDYSSSDIGLLLGLNAEVTIEKHLKKGIEVGGGLQYRVASYGVEGKIDEGGGVNYRVVNRSNMLRTPLFIRYNHNYDKLDNDGNRVKLIPYVFLGAAFELTLNAEYVDTDRSGGTPFTLTENNSLTDLDQVATQNVSLLGGIGAKYRVGRAKVDFLTFELRYDNSLFNYINPDSRWDNDDVAWGIGHVEDDLTLNAISFTIGFTKSFYSPKKRKEYR